MVGIRRCRCVQRGIFGRRERIGLDHALNKLSVDLQLFIYL